jgi:hypothetical protein
MAFVNGMLAVYVFTALFNLSVSTLGRPIYTPHSWSGCESAARLERAELINVLASGQECLACHDPALDTIGYRGMPRNIPVQAIRRACCLRKQCVQDAYNSSKLNVGARMHEGLDDREVELDLANKRFDGGTGHHRCRR